MCSARCAPTAQRRRSCPTRAAWQAASGLRSSRASRRPSRPRSRRGAVRIIRLRPGRRDAVGTGVGCEPASRLQGTTPDACPRRLPSPRAELLCARAGRPSKHGRGSQPSWTPSRSAPSTAPQPAQCPAARAARSADKGSPLQAAPAGGTWCPAAALFAAAPRRWEEAAHPAPGAPSPRAAPPPARGIQVLFFAPAQWSSSNPSCATGPALAARRPCKPILPLGAAPLRACSERCAPQRGTRTRDSWRLRGISTDY